MQGPHRLSGSTRCSALARQASFLVTVQHERALRVARESEFWAAVSAGRPKNGRPTGGHADFRASANRQVPIRQCADDGKRPQRPQTVRFIPRGLKKPFPGTGNRFRDIVPANRTLVQNRRACRENHSLRCRCSSAIRLLSVSANRWWFLSACRRQLCRSGRSCGGCRRGRDIRRSRASQKYKRRHPART
ncbi:MAG: hypothetical protein CM1200mP2_54070 [Planctomycetaceae bacterium]|nr:MAG: hypothetical protein CM1200mP2_54070 [Planctomycetaceae bacterium]